MSENENQPEVIEVINDNEPVVPEVIDVPDEVPDVVDDQGTSEVLASKPAVETAVPAPPKPASKAVVQDSSNGSSGGNALYEKDGGWLLDKVPPYSFRVQKQGTKKQGGVQSQIEMDITSATASGAALHSGAGGASKSEFKKDYANGNQSIMINKSNLNNNQGSKPPGKCCLDKPSEPMSLARQITAAYDSLSGRETFPCNECDRPICHESLWHWFASVVSDLVDAAKELTKRPETASKGCGSMDADTLKDNTKGTYAAFDLDDTLQATGFASSSPSKTLGAKASSHPAASKPKEAKPVPVMSKVKAVNAESKVDAVAVSSSKPGNTASKMAQNVAKVEPGPVAEASPEVEGAVDSVSLAFPPEEPVQDLAPLEESKALDSKIQIELIQSGSGVSVPEAPPTTEDTSDKPNVQSLVEIFEAKSKAADVMSKTDATAPGNISKTASSAKAKKGKK